MIRKKKQREKRLQDCLCEYGPSPRWIVSEENDSSKLMSENKALINSMRSCFDEFVATREVCSPWVQFQSSKKLVENQGLNHPDCSCVLANKNVHDICNIMMKISCKNANRVPNRIQ